MNAIEQAIELTNSSESGLFAQEIDLALRLGGLVLASPTCVCIGAPYSPDGSELRTFCVFYAGGDPVALAEQASILVRDGYERIAWTLELKRGLDDWHYADVSRWRRLVKVLNRKGSSA